MKRAVSVMLAVITAVMFTVSAAAVTWERYDEWDNKESIPQEYPTPFFDLVVRPLTVWAGLPEEQGCRIYMANYLEEKVSGTLILTSDIIKGGNAMISFVLDEIGSGANGESKELLLAPELKTGDYKIKAELVYDSDRKSTYRTDFTLHVEEPETCYFQVGETTEYFIGNGERLVTSDETIASVSGGIVKGEAPGTCYIMKYPADDESIYEYHTFCYKFVIDPRNMPDTDVKLSYDPDTEYEIYDPEYNVPKINNEGNIVIESLGYGTFDDFGGNYYSFKITNTSSSEAEVTVTGKSELIKNGAYSAPVTLSANGKEGSAKTVHVPLIEDFTQTTLNVGGKTANFNVVSETDSGFETSTLEIKLYAGDPTRIHFIPGQTYELEDYMWISDTPEIVSVEGTSAAVHETGWAMLTGTNKAGEMMVYDVFAHEDNSAPLDSEDFSGLVDVEKTQKKEPVTSKIHNKLSVFIIYIILLGILMYVKKKHYRENGGYDRTPSFFRKR